jgi:hypothetical protein
MCTGGCGGSKKKDSKMAVKAAVIRGRIQETTGLVAMAGFGVVYGNVTGIRYPFANGKQYVDLRDAEGLFERGYLYA